jgi:hypothetical protein
MPKKKTSKNVGPVKLDHSRVVRPKLDQLGHKKDTRGFRQTRRTIEGVTIPRPIQLYRYWFLYLKLALELDSLKYHFTEYERVEIKKKKGDDRAGHRYRYKEILEPVIVNRERYEEWDLYSVENDRFDVWWKIHKSKFIDEPTKEIYKGGEIGDSDHFRYFRVDTRKSLTDTMNELKEHLVVKTRRRTSSQAQWVINGEFREEALFNRYNALIMNIEGMKSPDILKSRLFRRSRGEEVSRSSNSQQNSQKMRDLLQPARKLVLTVADGYFMNHPRRKIYFKRSKK